MPGPIGLGREFFQTKFTLMNVHFIYNALACCSMTLTIVFSWKILSTFLTWILHNNIGVLLNLVAKQIARSRKCPIADFTFIIHGLKRIEWHSWRVLRRILLRGTLISSFCHLKLASKAFSSHLNLTNLAPKVRI